MGWLGAMLAKPLIKKFGKPLLMMFALGLISWWVSHQWHQYTEGLVAKGDRAGYERARSEFEKRIAAADDDNRRVEEAIAAATEKFVAAVAESDSRRVRSEQIIRDRLVTKVETMNNGEECRVPKDVIEERNKIRALGPEGENK